MSAGDKDRSGFHRLGGSLTQAQITCLNRGARTLHASYAGGSARETAGARPLILNPHFPESTFYDFDGTDPVSRPAGNKPIAPAAAGAF